ncbi:MAG: recombinase family protein [Mediterraneibacter gnavus]
MKLIFEKYANENLGIFEIARLLNMHNFKTSHGKEFERRSIEYILQNPTYCGMIRWNRTINESNEIRPESEWIVTDGEHPAIINKELFDKAQERYKREYRPRGARPASTYKHWLSGVVKRPTCGRTMTANTIRNNTRVYSHFRCYGYTKGKCMANNSISSIKLEPAVLESIKTVLDNGKIIYRKIEAKTDDTVDLKTILEDQIKKIDVKLQRIKEAYMNGIDTMEEYKENKQAVQEEKQHP